MTSCFIKLTKLIGGLFLYALGIITTIKAHIGYAPWDVFHVGLSKTTGLSLGTISILVGFIIVLATVLLGETFGLGTILNMILIGIFIDIIIVLNLIPKANNQVTGIIMLMAGLVLISFATYLYISPGFGAGPRDGLMVVMSRKFNRSPGFCRGLLEFTITLIGYALGGMVGIGTILYVSVIGFAIQLTFKFLHFNPKKIEHQNIRETANYIYKCFKT